MLWRRFTRQFRDVEQHELNIGAGTAFGFVVRVATYLLVAVGGIIVARELGAHDRGVYSLVTAISTYAVFLEVGITNAGVYLVGQKRFSLQQIVSNNAAWLLICAAVWVSVSVALAVIRPGFIPDSVNSEYFTIFAIGGVCLLAIGTAKEMIVTSGSVVRYGIVEFTEPFLRALFIIVGVLALGFGIIGVLFGWLLALTIATVLAIAFVARTSRLTPALEGKILKAQFTFGVRSFFGYVLQSLNQRLDVVLVAAFVSTTALGYYAVAFGMAELLWQIPFALGPFLFPKMSALSHTENARVAAATCRRALFITLFPTIGLVVVGRFLIELLYGSEFTEGVTAFYILAPSAMIYIVQKVLGSAIAARGMPEIGIYTGLVSVPATIILGVLLIPTMGIEGAALASIIAYSLNALTALAIFVKLTGVSPLDVLLVNRDDFSSSIQVARTMLAREEAQA